MATESSLPHSHLPATCPYPEPDQSNLCSPSHFMNSHLNITLPSTPGSSKWSLSLTFPHQNLIYTSPRPHTCYMSRPSHSIDTINRTILGEQYRSLSSSLCSFLHSPITTSLLGPNILNTLSSNPPQPTFLLQYERPSYTPIKNNRQKLSLNHANAPQYYT